MIEVIYKEEKQGAAGNEGMFAIPKNIRQIGIPEEGYRIYVEDYVYTFLVRLGGMETKGEKEKGHLAVLTGDVKWQAGVTYIFVRGAIIVEKAEAAADHIDFTPEIWTKIHDEQGLYFPEQDIVGWFFAQQELSLEVTEIFKRVHLKHFGGGEKVLMLMDPAEREDAFFRYENSYLIREPGYFLFYEKNPLMQNYMLDKNQEVVPEKTEDISDDAVIAFRRIIRAKKKSGKVKNEEEEKTENLEEEEGTSVFSYAATVCLALAVLVVGVNFYQNYQTEYGIEQELTGKYTVSVTPIVETGVSIDQNGKTTTGQNRSVMGQETAEKEEEKQAGVNQTDGAESLKDTVTMEKEAVNVDKDKTEDNEEKENGIKENETQENETRENGIGESVTKEDESKGSDASESESTGLQNDDIEEKESTESGESDAVSAERKSGMAEETVEQNQIYQEESDIRKAQRKQALAEQETQNGQGNTTSSQTVSSDSAHTSYVIRPGDTLYQISIEKYGTIEAISQICELNGISPEEIIYPGQIIVLP